MFKLQRKPNPAPTGLAFFVGVLILFLSFGSCQKEHKTNQIKPQTIHSLFWFCEKTTPLDLESESNCCLIAIGLNEWANCYFENPPKRFGMFMVNLRLELKKRGIDVTSPEDYSREGDKCLGEENKEVKDEV